MLLIFFNDGKGTPSYYFHLQVFVPGIAWRERRWSITKTEAIPNNYSVIIMIAVNLTSRDFLILCESNDIKPLDKEMLSFLFRFKQLFISFSF